MHAPQHTVWDEFVTPDASTDRGWLKALCAPYSWENHSEYNDANMPIQDETVPGGWREQSTLGNYLDYGPCRVGTYSEESIARNWPDGMVHCVCYLTHTSKYVRTVEEAREWIEQQAITARPWLVFHRSLMFAA